MELRIKDISFNYDSIPILENVTFNAREGRILGIIGPNGSGKTTLLRCIANTLKPHSGLIIVDEKSTLDFKNKELAKILSVVPQTTTLDANFTVFETVLMGRYPHLGALQRESEKDFSIVNSTLDLVNIRHLANRGTNELSGGEKRLISIALALAQEPKIFLLDEPTIHLDINMQYAIMDLCHFISRKSKVMVIIVLHDLSLAAQYCDDLIILKNGKITAAGSHNEVIEEEMIKETYGVQVVVGEDKATGLKYILPRKA